jgi:hypothetical protein
MIRSDSTRPVAIGAVLLLVGAAATAQAPPPRPAGIYLEVPGKSGDDAVIKIHGAFATEMKTKGMAGMMLTGGLKKAGMVGVLAGAAATVRAAGGDVAFDFYFDQRAGSSPMSMTPEDAMKMMGGDGMPMMAHRAEEFMLIRLTPKENEREAQLGAVGSTGKSKDAVPCAFQTLAPGIFRVRPKDPLPPGEYAFTFVSQGGGGQLWDFGVDSK